MIVIGYDILLAWHKRYRCGGEPGEGCWPATRDRMPPTPASSVRLADAVAVFLATIAVPNTRETYAAALDRLVTDFGADTNVALLDSEPDRVSGWFTFVWGAKAAKTFTSG
jgi:hypothetical protein